MTKIIIEDSDPQVKEFVAYACKSVVVKSYPPVLSLHVAKKPYTYFVYPKPFQRKQDIQNTHLRDDWIGIANEQLIIHHSTQSARKRISTEKYAYLSIIGKADSAAQPTRHREKIIN